MHIKDKYFYIQNGVKILKNKRYWKESEFDIFRHILNLYGYNIDYETYIKINTPEHYKLNFSIKLSEIISRAKFSSKTLEYFENDTYKVKQYLRGLKEDYESCKKEEWFD